jgi:hypothetical protein
MTPRRQYSKAFLSLGGFPERGTGQPHAVAVAGLTFSLSGANLPLLSQRFFISSQAGLRQDATTTKELPSFRGRGQAPSPFHRFRRSFCLGLMDWRYRCRADPCGGRSRTLTGQCRYPLCPGDTTNHSDGLRVVTKYRRQRRGLISPGFHWLRSLAPHPSRNVTPPGLSSPGPFVAVCYLPTLAAYPDQCQVRVKISERAWTRSGRI